MGVKGHFKQKRQRNRFQFLKDPSGKIMADGLEGDEIAGRKPISHLDRSLGRE